MGRTSRIMPISTQGIKKIPVFFRLGQRGPNRRFRGMRLWNTGDHGRAASNSAQQLWIIRGKCCRQPDRRWPCRPRFAASAGVFRGLSRTLSQRKFRDRIGRSPIEDDDDDDADGSGDSSAESTSRINGASNSGAANCGPERNRGAV